MNEKNLIIHMMSHLPVSYDETVTLLSMWLCSKADPLDLETFKQIICDRYERQVRREGTKTNVALVAENKNSKNDEKKRFRDPFFRVCIIRKRNFRCKFCNQGS